MKDGLKRFLFICPLRAHNFEECSTDPFSDLKQPHKSWLHKALLYQTTSETSGLIEK